MQTSRTSFWFRSTLLAAAVALGMLTLTTTALAFGTFRLKRTTVQEADGRWKFNVEVDYGSKPHIGHIPFDFVFVQKTYYEYSITDNDPKPVQRRKPMLNQPPQREQMDIGFADARGDIWRRTKFSFSLRRDRGFSAGEYTLTVKRTSDGRVLGRPMRIILNGQNELIDRRAIVFAGPKKKSKDKATKTDDAPSGADEGGSGDKADNAADEEKEDTVPEDVEPPDDPVAEPEADGPPPVEKRRNGAGCGCRAAGMGPRDSVPLLGLLMLGLLGWSRRGRH